MLVSDLANIRYLSGYTNDTGVLLITETEQYLLTDFRFL
ncbi:MAG: aminopeptidase P family N-terminal domain-containing protein, partial [Lachnospiraceae bacterium]|nr:aminopeptidase P family N-terminal domain-containing protein [Lachnospiraceae bacterium]